MEVISGGGRTMAAGDWHSMVLMHDGSLWATGANNYGQLGDGSTIDKNTFERVLPSSRDGAWRISAYISSFEFGFCEPRG